MDSAELQKKIARLRSELAVHLKGVVQMVPAILQALIAEHYDEGKKQAPADRWFRSGPRLMDDSGELQRSFIPGQPGNIYEVKQNGTTVTVTYGTSVSHAALLDANGERKSVKVFSKGKMEGFFWGQYKQSQNLFWKILGLKVKRDGFITRTTKPFWTPAVKAFEKGKGREMMTRELLKIIARVWNGS